MFQTTNQCLLATTNSILSSTFNLWGRIGNLVTRSYFSIWRVADQNHSHYGLPRFWPAQAGLPGGNRTPKLRTGRSLNRGSTSFWPVAVWTYSCIVLTIFCQHPKHLFINIYPLSIYVRWCSLWLPLHRAPRPLIHLLWSISSDGVSSNHLQ